MTIRKPYTGMHRKLVLGIDIGTTYSGITYALLVPGQIPEIKGVTRFPAQEHVGGDSKIPSVILYDKSGVARAIGAETLQESVIELAEDEGWTRVEWFKLHLRPKGADTRHLKSLILPRNKSIIGIYADYLRYLHSCARTYIEQTHANGNALWDSVKNNIEYVITHPNGWEGTQQAHIRRAAVEAGLTRDGADGQKRLQFLTEGEASLHFCVQNGLGNDITGTEQGVIIIDAGGGTIDFSAFSATSENGFEEISVPECHFQGSVFVTRRARTYLEEKFSRTKFANDVPHMTTVFDRTTKLRFRSADEPAYIRFGGLLDKDPALNIRAGNLMLDGAEVAGFFMPPIDTIIQVVMNQYKDGHKPFSNVFLVGGFAASDFVFTTLQVALAPLDIAVSRPDAHANKAAADGAIMFYLDRLVSLRVSQFDYGICHSVSYVPSSMSSRKKLLYIDAKGEFKVPGRFTVILPKNTQVMEAQSFSYSHYERADSASALGQCSSEIQCYHGDMEPCPEWINLDTDKFRKLCTITGDLSSIPKQRLGPIFKSYYEVRYNVNITFGPAEMSAYLTWDDNGVQKSGPTQIIYDAELEEDKNVA